MEDRLRKYINELFDGTLPTKKTVELKEEMLQNLREKYADLIMEGKSEEAAYNIAVASIGDISELLDSLESGTPEFSEEYEKGRQKSALLTSVAVMLFILAGIPVLLTDSVIGETVGLIIAIIFVAAGVGILIYNSMTRPRYMRKEDTIVEEYKERAAGKKEAKGLRAAISGLLWTLVLAVYFLVSFTTYAWYITWVIFLIGAAIECVISIIYTAKK